MKAFRAVLILMPLLVAACAAEARRAKSPEIESAYRRVLMEEVCASNAVTRDGRGGERLRAERQRLRILLHEAEAAGLSEVLRETERRWAHFQTVADWVCGEGAGPASLGLAIDQLASSVASASRE